MVHHSPAQPLPGKARGKVALLTPNAAHIARMMAMQQGFDRHGYKTVPVVAAGNMDHLKRALDGCSFGLCSGTREGSAIARKACAELGIPYVVVDLGYLKRSASAKDLTGYNQAGWNKIGWVPSAHLPPDRFDALEIPVAAERHGPYSKDEALVVGQVANDGQHGMNVSTLSAWLSHFTDQTVALNPEIKKVWFRPHPLARDAQLNCRTPHARQDPSMQSLHVAMTTKAFVITYNSTVGVEAMLAAVPVKCAPTAHFAAAANGSYAQRKAYLDRLAYAQWTLEEMRSGEAVAFLLDHKP